MSMSSKAKTEIQMTYVPSFPVLLIQIKRQAGIHSEASKPRERGIKEKGRR